MDLHTSNTESEAGLDHRRAKNGPEIYGMSASTLRVLWLNALEHLARAVVGREPRLILGGQ